MPISFESDVKVITVNESLEVVIPCEVTGYPEPTIQWYFNGLPLLENGKLTCINHPRGCNFIAKFTVEEMRYRQLEDGLYIQNVNRSDMGEYTCKALQISKITNNIEELTIRLNVHCKVELS